MRNLCHCPTDTPVLLKGILPTPPLQCLECQLPVALESSNATIELFISIHRWHQEYRQLEKQNLEDVISSINLEGFELSQQLNKIKTTYYWVFQDISNATYIQPKLCPFCGGLMQAIKHSNINVCHDCKVAYPEDNRAALRN